MKRLLKHTGRNQQTNVRHVCDKSMETMDNEGNFLYIKDRLHLAASPYAVRLGMANGSE